MRNPASKSWEFETFDRTAYHRFLMTLELFKIEPTVKSDLYPGDSSQIIFWATKTDRLKIEYVFRRMFSLDHRYLMDIDSYQSRCELYREEKYAIY